MIKRWLTRPNPTTFGARAVSLLALALGSSLLVGAHAADSLDSIPAGPLTPLGRYADMGGYRLHYHCVGDENASQTVLLESGIGGAINGWEGVQQALAASARVCAYDRAGYGWSDPGPGARSVDELTDELHKLVERIGLRTPMVLVGHSFGGFIVRHYASRWPEQVAGVVFVDSSLTDNLIEIGDADDDGPRPMHPINAKAIRVGSVDDPGAGGGFLNSRRKAIFTQMAEFQHFARSAEMVESGGNVPEGRPVAVLARTRMSAEESASFNERWLAAQERFAASMPGARFVAVEDAGHSIHEDRPDVVSEAIRTVLTEAGQCGAGSEHRGTNCLARSGSH